MQQLQLHLWAALAGANIGQWRPRNAEGRSIIEKHQHSMLLACSEDLETHAISGQLLPWGVKNSQKVNTVLVWCIIFKKQFYDKMEHEEGEK